MPILYQKCDKFAINFLLELGINILENDLDLTTITHQETQKEIISDFEIFYSNKFHIIVEAKKGTILPSVNQLTKYVNT